ncbi:MAG: alpha/beta fold hydrolase [Novosphingobium sp.]|nr:alpha/beta fold hydrolase [Novosphingobium sp.]MCP5402985.1 alpha/beta fold hydrolase [Novosphingobium sp.]
MAVFVLVHGGGHGGWCWDRLAPLLRDAGHEVHIPVLKGVGERFGELTADIGLSTHVEEVAKLIADRDLRDVILVGHSYGCMVITGVAGSVPGRIAELVFLDGPHPRDGEALEHASPGMREVLEPQMREVDGVELCLFPNAETMHVYGIREPEDVAWASRHLTPHPWKCFVEPLRLKDAAGMAAVPRTSIDCIESGNRRDPEMNARAKAADRCWEIDTGHDLMISEPRATADMLLRVAAEPLRRTASRA